MNYLQALEYIHKNCWQGSKPGLSRTRELLKALGDPQSRLKFIHVAGTNGKGSFCSMLSSVLTKAGYKVGTYTSPYILRFNERMKINGNDIPDDTLAALTEKICPLAEKMEDHPTEFELITALAMDYFSQEECDVVVLECGMGGRLDSTNVIPSPLLGVITGIAIDHAAFLGDTEEKIAAEKAGIIKEGCDLLWCGDSPEAEGVIREKAKAEKARVHIPNRSELTPISFELSHTTLRSEELGEITLPLLGSYQVNNLENVLAAIKLLKAKGFDIPNSAVKDGIASTVWHARYEKVQDSPTVICDGGHNPQGIDAAVESTKLYFKNEKLLVLTGVMADKDYRYMAKKISGIASKVFCITPDNPRSLKAEEYAKVFRQNDICAEGFDTVDEAVKKAVSEAKKENRALLCLGSLYMYSEVIDSLKKY